MGKKRPRDETAEKPAKEASKGKDKDSSDDEDFDVVNVDFEWFNFDKEIDFHGVKSLLRQLVDVDGTLFDLSAIADLIIAQDTIGSTVKVDGKGTDAYAFLTVLDTARPGHPALVRLVDYLIEKADSSPDGALEPVAGLLRRGGSGDTGDGRVQVGLLLSERLINIPPEIAPPMYSSLLEEVEAAVEDGEPYGFTHWLVLSKTYSEVASALDAETKERNRKRKKARDGVPLVLYFHPEDEVLAGHAAAHGGFAYTKEDDAVADSKRAFQEMGIKTQGYMMLIEADKFAGAVAAVGDYLRPPAT